MHEILCISLLAWNVKSNLTVAWYETSTISMLHAKLGKERRRITLYGTVCAFSSLSR